MFANAAGSIDKANRLFPLQRSRSLAAVGFITAVLMAPAAFAQDSRALQMRLDGNLPISIDAQDFVVREAESVAVFTGNVDVVQGNTSLKTGKLVVHYAKSGGSVATGTAAIERLEMSDKVVIRSATQTATGDAASFDMKSNVFRITGSKVVLSDGDNVAVGCALTVQMRSGQARLEACKGGSGKGRVQILINPKSAQNN
jgi:lipopolysaccharide export system protein LptA